MQVKEIENKGLKRAYNVTVDADNINTQLEKRLNALSSNVKIPGFRPGKIPMKVLKQKYGKQVMAEVLEKTVNDSSQNVMKDKKLQPALPAQIKINDYKEGGELNFDMTLEVLPEIPTVDFDKITLERLTYDVDQKEIDEGIARLAERYKDYELLGKDHKAKKGNVVEIDFLGKKDGEPFEGGKGSHFKLELGSNSFIDGFEEQLIGVKAGDELTIDVTFPKDYHKDDLAGQPAQFDIVVHDVLKAVTPKVDDEFAKKVGFEKVDELKEAVSKQFTADYDQFVRAKLKKQLFDHMDETMAFKVPESMVKLEFDAIWKRLEDAIEQKDPSVVDRDEDELKEEYETISERRVRLGLILSGVAKENKLEANQEELSKAVMEQARQFPGQEKKIFDYYREHPQQLDELRGPIIEEKAVDFILENVKFKDKKVSLEELTKEDDDDAPSTKKSSKSAKPKKKASKAPAKKAKTTGAKKSEGKASTAKSKTGTKKKKTG